MRGVQLGATLRMVFELAFPDGNSELLEGKVNSEFSVDKLSCSPCSTLVISNIYEVHIL